MKKLIICGILSLSIGGVANASTSDFNTYESTFLQTTTQESEYEVLHYGVDDGGTYAIVSTDTKCMKVYLNSKEDFEGMIDH